MVLIIDDNMSFLKLKEIWFAEQPYDVPDCDSVAFMSCKKPNGTKFWDCRPFTTLIIDLSQDLEEIWANLDKATRYHINRATKSGVKIHVNKYYDEFFRINESFRSKKGLNSNSRKLKAITEYGTLFTADYQGEILGGVFSLEDENNFQELIGASKRLESNHEKSKLVGHANRLIVWEEIKYAKTKNKKEFDMGGYYTGEKKDLEMEKLNQSKKGFNGILVTRFNCRKNYSSIAKIAINANRKLQISKMLKI